MVPGQLLINIVVPGERCLYNSYMTEVLQANVFFFITAMSVIVFTTFLCVIAYYVIGILRSVRSIVRRIDASSEVVAEDVRQLREYITKGSLVSQIVGMFINTRRAKKRREEDEE